MPRVTPIPSFFSSPSPTLQSSPLHPISHYLVNPFISYLLPLSSATPSTLPTRQTSPLHHESHHYPHPVSSHPHLCPDHDGLHDYNIMSTTKLL
ncbi:hypothetical protein BO71DRAFT_402206 [Aspergillus ellipticus CBS 707.79]|uniref:Uncharacterized protein n=1 Tax=Aspergillus ellipticus CBS 707.79 TaxID=1448320 RepID=A0A319CYV1_9EURO|nr:hypothetical protein BO71DRAFT_402206 [Aspergillus ellipticus CBS 707.79]